MKHLTLSALSGLALAGPLVQRQPSFKADIRADTNRDGVVDVLGSTDVDGKDSWSDTVGAIFLANIGDTGRRCAQANPDPDTPLSTLAACHDASDDVQRAPRYMAPIRTVPIAGLGESAAGTVSVSDPVARPLVRIFRPKGDDSWEIVENNTTFSAQELERGLTLGIDACDTRRPGGWNGRVMVDFTVKDGEQTSMDSVMLRVAPILVHHHRQAIQRVFTSSIEFKGSMDGEFKRKKRARIEAVMSGIEQALGKARIPGRLDRLPTDDPWARDYFKAGYTSMPGPDGPLSMRVMIQGRRDDNNAVRLIYTHLRTDGMGGLMASQIADNRKNDDNFQAGGNIISIPPYELNGKTYPAGRIVMGGNETRFPRALEYFRAQETQHLVMLDTTWLRVGHVDEIIQFLPAKTRRGWSVVAVDPKAGVELLRQAQARGQGRQAFVSHDKADSQIMRHSIDRFFEIDGNLQAANVSARRIEESLDIIRRETGISDAEIFRVPTLYGTRRLVERHLLAPTFFNRRRDLGRDGQESASLVSVFASRMNEHASEGEPDGQSDIERRQLGRSGPQLLPLNSYLPSPVNGIPLSDSVYLAPKPWGPIVDGQDIFEAAVRAAYEAAGFSVEFVDDWEFHVGSGDVHCLSNSFRDASARWW